jgi:uncharacterized membrane protein
MTYSPMLLAHIVAGMIATLFGMVALLVRKGSPWHRKTGDVFVLAMMTMAASGGYLALLKSQRFNVFAGVFTLYLVATAALTVMRRRPWSTRVEVGFFLLVVVTAALGWTFASTATSRANAISYGIFGSLATLSGLGDLRMLLRGGVTGAQRLVRHIWRMGFALFIAAGSFFLGTASDPVLRRSGLRATLFTKEIRATHLPAVPVVLIVALTLFWLFRVKLASSYRRAAE